MNTSTEPHVSKPRTTPTAGPKFSLGRLLITPNARDTLPAHEVLNALARHARGEWGDCSEHDGQANERALMDGSRLFSVYHDAQGRRFWVITEAGRHATTVLLPEDY